MARTVGSPHASEASPLRWCDCACNAEKIRAVEDCLKEHFPGYEERYLHSRGFVTRVGGLVPSGDHHVVSIGADGRPRYSVVLTSEFLEHHPLAGVRELLRHWDVAAALRAHHVVILWKSGASPL